MSFLEQLQSFFSQILPFLPDYPHRGWIALSAGLSVTLGLILSGVFSLADIWIKDPSTLLSQAEKDARNGKYKAALSVFLQFGAFDRAASMAQKLEQHENAAEYALKAQDFALAGKLLSQLGRFSEAGQAFEKAGRLKDAADQFMKAGEKERALPKYRQLGMLDQVETILRSMGRFKELGVMYRNYFEKRRSDLPPNPEPKQTEEVQNFARKAERAFLDGKEFKSAVEILVKAGLLKEAARVQESQGNPIEAGDLYRQAGQLEEAARCFEAAGKFDWAIDIYQEIGKLDRIPKLLQAAGKREEASLAQAEILVKEGKRTEAADAFFTAGAYREAAEIYLELGNHERAALCWEKSGNYSRAAISYEILSDWKKAAENYAKSRNYEEAAKAFEKAKMNHEAIESYIAAQKFFEAGKLADSIGSKEDAVQYFQSIPQKSEQWILAQQSLARLLLEKGNLKLAEEKFQSLIGQLALSRETLDFYYDYALFLERKNEVKKANEIYEAILALDFHFRDVIERKKNIEAKIKTKLTSTPNLEKATIRGQQPVTSFVDVGKILGERYRITGELGRGAMGLILSGHDTKLDRPVAMKVLPPSQVTEKQRERFMREAQVLAKLNHRNIVRVFDFGVEGRLHYFVMEHVDGINLKDLLERAGSLPWKEFFFLAKQIVDGLEYAHSQDIVHRDIKPANILVNREKVLKIADFGLAKVVKDSVASATQALGSPFYMAPEQIEGKSITPQMDLYALGVVFYELLTGKVPFYEGEVAYHHLHTAPKPIQELRKDCPEKISSLVMKLLAKDPNDRPGSASEIKNLFLVS